MSDVENQHPEDPPDLGRHYADRAERAIRESEANHAHGGRRLSDHEQSLRALQAIALAALAVGERLARVGYAANRVQATLERLLVHQLPDEPVKPEPVDERPPPEPGAVWTPATGDDPGPRAVPEGGLRRCPSCHHSLDYPPALECQRRNEHEIPF